MPSERDHLGVEITGLGELTAMFDEIGEIGTKAAIQAAARKAVKPIAEEARRLARRSGIDRGPHKKALADSIVIRSTLPRSQRRKRGGRKHPVEVFVIATAPHAHLIEWGHRLVKGKSSAGEILSWRKVRVTEGRRKGQFVRHIIKRGAPTVGRDLGKRARAFPFMRPAFDSKKREAVGIFTREVGNEVVRVAERYARQTERGKPSRGARLAFNVEV